MVGLREVAGVGWAVAAAAVLAQPTPAFAQVNFWTSGFDGSWHDEVNWLLGLPDVTNSALAINNAGSKTVTIDFVTSAFFPQSLTISNLLLAAPPGATNTLSLSEAGTDVPLGVLDNVSVGGGGSLIIGGSVLRVDGRAGGGLSLDGTLTLNSGLLVATNLILRVGNVGRGSLVLNGGVCLARDVLVAANPLARGTVTLAGGTLSAETLTLTNAQSSIAFSNGTLIVRDVIANNGQPFVVGDGVEAAAFTLDGGLGWFATGLRIATNAALIAAGTLSGDLTCDGRLAPGDLTINGNATFRDAASVSFELGGYAQGLEHDFLFVAALTTLAGTLEVAFVNGFERSITNGSSFVLLATPGLVGQFANVGEGGRLATTDGFGSFEVHYLSGGLLLSDYRAALPPGDVDGDTHVTGADSLLINQVQVGLRATNDGSFAVAGFANGDVNQTNAVTGADSLLINQVLQTRRAYVVTKILPPSHSSNQTTAVTIYGIGFPTNGPAPAVKIEPPVDLMLTNVTVLSREQITATVPAGGNVGTGAVSVAFPLTNGVISFGRFRNE